VNAVLKRIAAKEAGTREIFEDKWSVSEKIELVLKVIQERTPVKFSELFETAANRWEVICTFLALLELIRLKQLSCVQPEPFAEIEICRAKPEDGGSRPAAEEAPAEESGQGQLFPARLSEVAPEASQGPEISAQPTHHGAEPTPAEDAPPPPDPAPQ
jgi:hypothetical protein